MIRSKIGLARRAKPRISFRFVFIFGVKRNRRNSFVPVKLKSEIANPFAAL